MFRVHEPRTALGCACRGLKGLKEFCIDRAVYDTNIQDPGTANVRLFALIHMSLDTLVYLQLDIDQGRCRPQEFYLRDAAPTLQPSNTGRGKAMLSY
ncbi:hypothetical protein PLICRDRAFT_526665 [Plicaturopsis crispa FD-325 SS-3]|nr:hypothetical protein PLICRDRAFT_526665 [Plicaturopsis crispa FD-325 SS-3]